MKEQFVSLLISKVGLDKEKAEKSVETILNFFKENPQQIEKLGAGDVVGKLSSVFGK